jgi:hypothetical protein
VAATWRTQAVSRTPRLAPIGTTADEHPAPRRRRDHRCSHLATRAGLERRIRVDGRARIATVRSPRAMIASSLTTEAQTGRWRTPLSTVDANRGAIRRFDGWPSDRGNAPPPVDCPGNVLRLVHTARAIPAKPALASIGRPNSLLSRRHGWRLECLRASRCHARPTERNQEEARMIEHLSQPDVTGEVGGPALEGCVQLLRRYEGVV